MTAILVVTGCKHHDEPAAATSDFTVLAQEAEGFLQATPGQPLEFPRDHDAHPGYRIEWWYLTANLEDEQGQSYGAQWTLFRFQANPSDERPKTNAWQSDQLFMAHFAVTTPDDHQAFQRYARGGNGQDLTQADVRIEPFAAWLDDWRLESTGDEWLPLEVSARSGSTAMDLNLSAGGPMILQGYKGFSQKHPNGGGSFYYSHPFLKADGLLTVDGQMITVSGEAWIDREWSSQFLQADQSGWDWFSIHLDSGEKLMLFRLRGTADDGGSGNYQYGTLIQADGSQQSLDPGNIVMEPLDFKSVAGRQLPLRWRISLPDIDRDFEVTALHPDQWMDLDYPYWEGVILVEGPTPGNEGRGYLEMTGY